MMADKKSTMPSIPMLKMTSIIAVAIVVATLGFSWFSESSLLYVFEDVATEATIVKPNISNKPDNLFFALEYSACPGVTESINLGKKSLDEKAPQLLIDVRTCLSKIKVGTVVPVSIITREKRFGDSRAGKIDRIGQCDMPLLPTRLKMPDEVRCPWM
jgi:hypothetical protein